MLVPVGGVFVSSALANVSTPLGFRGGMAFNLLTVGHCSVVFLRSY
jgi:hypothetical protein